MAIAPPALRFIAPVAAAVQTSSRAVAQTAPASKHADSATSLSAQQKKPNVVRAAPVARPAVASIG